MSGANRFIKSVKLLKKLNVVFSLIFAVNLLIAPYIVLGQVPIEPTAEQLKNRSAFEVKPVTFGDKVFHYAFKYGLDRNNVEDLLEIMRCESGIRPIRSHKMNYDKSYDWYYLQVNDKRWYEFFKKKGLDIIENPDDALEAGIYLYSKYGASPWVASNSCHKLLSKK